GYESRYHALATKIKEHVPDAEISGDKGRKTSFEITLNDQLIFSKLKMGGFPFDEDVIQEVKKASHGEPVSLIQKKKSGCIII
uniref:Migration and invasion enhancer 1 n=1 Tax=Erpetoichthys calabaricus TaxID=27687 RepID=A0A8C4TKX1_ERPCA